MEAFTKKENAERKAETEQINSVLNAENDKRMKEAQALKEKMEKEKKELQAYLEKVRNYTIKGHVTRGDIESVNILQSVEVLRSPQYRCISSQ